MNAKELSSTLRQFTGTEHYYRLYKDVVLTDGVKYLADEAKCYWLMDAIATYLRFFQPKEYFACCKLKVVNESAVLTIDDGNGTILASQNIEYTDFPLPQIDLYGVWSEEFWVIMLTSEY
ncbi:MAG: hypothetical protein Q8R65_01760 [Polynucleobacter sp.]|nr:hypothetical protein [Polynucleobacter sp.]